MKIRVSVPASAGNTGSAFDSLGIAYGLENEIVLDTSAPGRVDAEGEGAELLRKGEPNLVHAALERFSAATGKKLPPVGLTLVNRIPFGRGLGSSAAAIVGGLVGADALAETGMSRESLLKLAIPMEGHPDNVAPALYGGAVLTVLDEGRADGPVTVVPFAAPAEWRAVLYVPDLVIPTKQARAILPKEVPRADAIFNHSRVGLLVAALERNRPDLLRVAMQDRLHQPYRARLFPEMEPLIAAGLAAGGWGACLSGAGSAVLALASAAVSASVEVALRSRAAELGVPGRTLVLEIPRRGARVLPA
jgi:homoserine kinase